MVTATGWDGVGEEAEETAEAEVVEEADKVEVEVEVAVLLPSSAASSGPTTRALFMGDGGGSPAGDADGASPGVEEAPAGPVGLRPAGPDWLLPAEPSTEGREEGGREEAGGE